MRYAAFALLLFFSCVFSACTVAPAVRPATLETPSSSSASFNHAAVAADHPLASRAGARILAQGGNAVDAAVATSFTLSVVRPYSCGIGGGGFMLIHLAPSPERPQGLDIALNYRETTPGAIDPLFYERHPDPHASTRGGAAVAVPGTVAGLLLALKRYGTLPRDVVLAPAIEAAELGFVVDDHYLGAARQTIRKFKENPEYERRFAFLWERYLHRGEIAPGHVIRNPEQAEALRLIARDGADAFYRGAIANAITDAVNRDAGPLTLDDLKSHAPRTVTPLRSNAFGATLLVMPPPSSGGIAIAQIFGVLDRLQFTSRDEAERAHLLTEAIKHAFADRAEYLADPDFSPVPTHVLLDSRYLDRTAARVSLHATDPDPSHYGSRLAPFPDDAGTSHLSVVDAHGNAVACTETFNLEFGSLLAVPEFGFCLNNEMDDFTTRRGEPNAFGLTQSDRNLPAPGKRPLSSMSPTIILNASAEVIAVAGASGGPRIISGSAQALLNSLVLDADAGAAVDAPRLHHQWLPDRLEYEAALSPRTDLLDALRARGHQLKPATSTSNVQLIVRARNAWQAACDPRKGGTPAGY